MRGHCNLYSKEIRLCAPFVLIILGSIANIYCLKGWVGGYMVSLEELNFHCENE